MRACKHGYTSRCFAFRALTRKYEFEKGFELKKSTSLLYLPISSSAESWKIFRNMLGQFFSAWADILSEKNPYFGKTSSRVCINVSNSPKPSRIYIRLCKHGKRFLLLKCSSGGCIFQFSPGKNKQQGLGLVLVIAESGSAKNPPRIIIL